MTHDGGHMPTTLKSTRSKSPETTSGCMPHSTQFGFLRRLQARPRLGSRYCDNHHPTRSWKTSPFALRMLGASNQAQCDLYRPPESIELQRPSLDGVSLLDHGSETFGHGRWIYFTRDDKAKLPYFSTILAPPCAPIRVVLGPIYSSASLLYRSCRDDGREDRSGRERQRHHETVPPCGNCEQQQTISNSAPSPLLNTTIRELPLSRHGRC